MNKRAHIPWMIILAAMCGGCSSTPPSGGSSPVQLGAAGSPSTSKNRLANADNGLELRRWTVVDTTGRVTEALAKHVDGEAIDEAAQQRLKRNGFRFLRVPIDQLEALLADIGGATVDANEWHGQVHEWRSLADRPIESRGRAVAIDGRVQRFDRGEFRLMIRSWSVQMEDGPSIHLELVPLHRQPQASGLRRLMGEESRTGTGYGSIALDIQLQPAYAYVLLSESPQRDWPGLDAPLTSPGSPSASVAKAKVFTPRVGPMDGAGPEAATPHSLGELLLPRDVDSGTRNLLVFVPKVAQELFPTALEPDAAEGEATP